MSRLRTGLAGAEAPAVAVLLNPSIESSEHLGGVAVTATEVRSDYLTLTRARSQSRVAPAPATADRVSRPPVPWPSAVAHRDRGRHRGLASRPFSPRPSSSTAPGWSPIVRRLRSAGLSGATTQRGIWGFHGDHPPHGDRLLQLGRHVPVVTIVIDTPKRISAAFSVIDELTSERGLVTSEIIPAMRASADDRQRGGTRLATHHLPDIPDPDIPDSGRGDGRD